MPTLLVIDTSPRKDAVSRSLTERFIERWSAVSPTGKVLHRDIGASLAPHFVQVGTRSRGGFELDRGLAQIAQ